MVWLMDVCSDGGNKEIFEILRMVLIPLPPNPVVIDVSYELDVENELTDLGIFATSYTLIVVDSKTI